MSYPVKVNEVYHVCLIICALALDSKLNNYCSYVPQNKAIKHIAYFNVKLHAPSINDWNPALLPTKRSLWFTISTFIKTHQSFLLEFGWAVGTRTLRLCVFNFTLPRA
jgi:hypothetical protein